MKTLLLSLVLLSGCALFEQPPKVGQPVVDPITGELRPATVDDALAEVARIQAELDVISDSAAAAGTNPWIAGTGIAVMLAAMAEAKRRRLALEKAKLLAELESRSLDVPKGIELT
jgi:hypothetical protein